MGLNRLILIMFLLTFLASAFNPDVHIYLAKGLLLKYYPHCSAQIEQGAVYPQNVLHDTTNDHCYTTTFCPAFDANYCPSLLTCPSIPTQEGWMNLAKNASDCEQAKDIAIASYYFTEPRDPMRQMVNVDQNCIIGFESQISQAIATSPSNFQISQKCTAPDRTFTYTNDDMHNVIIALDSGLITELFPIRSYPPNNSGTNNTGQNQTTGLKPKINGLNSQATFKQGATGTVQFSIINLGPSDGQFTLNVTCPQNISATYNSNLLISSGESKDITISLVSNDITSGICTVSISDSANAAFNDTRTFSFSIVKTCPQQCTGFQVQSSDPSSCSCVCDTSRLTKDCAAQGDVVNATSCTCSPSQGSTEQAPTKCLGIFLVLGGLFAGLRIIRPS